MLLAALLLFVLLTLGHYITPVIVKGRIIQQLSESTQTSVDLHSVNVSLTSQTIQLNRLRIGNPSGFKAPFLFSCGEVEIHFDLKSLFSSEITLDHVEIRHPEFFYENNGSSSNLGEIRSRMNALNAGNQHLAESQQHYRIQQCIVEDAFLYLDVMGIRSNRRLPRLVVEGDQRPLDISISIIEQLYAAYSQVDSASVSDAQEAGNRILDLGHLLLSPFLK